MKNVDKVTGKINMKNLHEVTDKIDKKMYMKLQVRLT